MSYIDGVYNTKTMEISFNSLINYFTSNQATIAEVDHLIMTNDHPVVRLLVDLKDFPRAQDLLRSTVGKVVIDGLDMEPPKPAACKELDFGDAPYSAGEEEIALTGATEEADA
jgi:hypothetical protein